MKYVSRSSTPYFCYSFRTTYFTDPRTKKSQDLITPAINFTALDFTARCYAERVIAMVCRLSFCLSVKLVDCDHIV